MGVSPRELSVVSFCIDIELHCKFRTLDYNIAKLLVNVLDKGDLTNTSKPKIILET